MDLLGVKGGEEVEGGGGNFFAIEHNVRIFL